MPPQDEFLCWLTLAYCIAKPTLQSFLYYHMCVCAFDLHPHTRCRFHYRNENNFTQLNTETLISHRSSLHPKHLRLNDVKVVAIITLLDDVVFRLNYLFEHRIQNLIHLQRYCIPHKIVIISSCFQTLTGSVTNY